MKDISRPHPTSSLRSAPYRKRKSTSVTSPTQGTRRVQDAQPQGHSRKIITPSPPDRAHSSLRDVAQSSRTISVDDDRRSLSKTGGNRNVPRAWRHTRTNWSARERPSHISTLNTHTDMSGSSFQLLSCAPPIATGFTGQRADSPPLGSATTFLRRIELPDKPSGAPLLQESSLTPLRLPPLSTDNTKKLACTNGNDYHVSLAYKGYPFTYDLSALPEDPKGTIALLTITESDPGAYLLIGAHYRRTGRSRAACAVIRSLLNNLDNPSAVEKGKRDGTLHVHLRIIQFEQASTAALIPASGTPTVTLVSPASPHSNPIDWSASVFRNAAMRPAMLLLAACELDISREHPDDPESTSHTSTAYDLFRAVYGTVNDAVVAGAARPQPKNALDLEFPSNTNCLFLSPSDSNGRPPSNVSPPEMEPPARIKDLEKELDATRAAQNKLQEKLAASNERLTHAEGKMHALESHSQDMLVQLDAWRDENWELRQRLVESEQMVKELSQCAPSTENRVWGRLKDLLFDNLGGVRGG